MKRLGHRVLQPTTKLNFTPFLHGGSWWDEVEHWPRFLGNAINGADVRMIGDGFTRQGEIEDVVYSLAGEQRLPWWRRRRKPKQQIGWNLFEIPRGAIATGMFTIPSNFSPWRVTFSPGATDVTAIRRPTHPDEF